MRIDDDSAERAQQAARAEERKLQDQQQKRRTDEATAFDKALQSRATEESTAGRFAQAQKKTAQSAIRSLLDARHDVSVEGKLEGHLEQAELENLADGAHQLEQQTDQQKLQHGLAGRKDVDRKTGRMVSEGRGDDARADAGMGEHVESSLREGEHHQAERTRDTAADQRRAAKREGEPGLRQSSGQGAGPKQVGDRPQKGRDSGQQQQGGSQNQPGAFRLPPAALMAPPPVAVPKAEAQVSRLRQLAQEIAEKIVQSARVGVNRMGLPEFQLELKSDILKGLKVKVSGRHGRIRATFASRDLQVLKQLRAEVDALKSALTARGLKVDALEIEEDRT